MTRRGGGYYPLHPSPIIYLSYTTYRQCITCCPGAGAGAGEAGAGEAGTVGVVVGTGSFDGCFAGAGSSAGVINRVRKRS